MPLEKHSDKNTFNVEDIINSNSFQTLPDVLQNYLLLIQAMDNLGLNTICDNADQKKDGNLLIHTPSKIRWDIEVLNLDDARMVAFEVIRFFLNSELLDNNSFKKTVFESDIKKQVNDLVYGDDKFIMGKNQINNILFQY